jgi:hypothetical protein
MLWAAVSSVTSAEIVATRARTTPVPRPAVELDWERSPVMFQGDGRVFRELRLRGGNVESHFDPRLFAFSRRVRSATTTMRREGKKP